MEWHVNDLSVAGQFRTDKSLQAALEPLLRLRISHPDVSSRVFCSRELYLRQAVGGETLLKSVMLVPDRNFQSLAIRWLANSGPFWDDDRTPNADDLFYLDEVDVTNQGLGESARRNLVGVEAAVISFMGAGDDIYANPLLIKQGLLEDVLNEIEIQNVTNLREIADDAAPIPLSWRDMLALASARLENLVFSNQLAAQLQPAPFYRGISDRITTLLNVLDEIAAHTQADGSVDPRGQELLQMHFVGQKASFTDESDGNKRDFRHDLTFPDPAVPSATLFCPWHGKVKIGQFRIHFEWPRPKGQKEMKIVYIGPKITKR